MIHNHSSGKHRLWRKVLSVCIAFAMICSVSISAFAVEASSETVNENIETVQSGCAEDAEELTATEAENDQSVDEAQPEEPAVTTGDENTEEPADVIETPSEDPEQPEEPSVEPGEEPIQPADPAVTEQPEEPTVTEQPEEPAATPAGDADASADEVQDVELEAQADAQTEDGAAALAVNDGTTLDLTDATVTIENTIKIDGCLKLKVTGKNGSEITAEQLKNARYTVTWYKDNNEAVLRKKVTGDSYNTAEDGSWVNVTLDNGAQKTYTVKITNENGNEVKTASGIKVDYYDSLQNGSFETPQAQNNGTYEPHVPSGENGIVWKTTGMKSGKTDHIELVSTASDKYCENGEMTHKAAAGNYHNMNHTNTANVNSGTQYAELNAESMGALYQDVLTTPGSTMYWSVDHNGRRGTDTMAVVIMSTKDAEKITTQRQLLTAIRDIQNGQYQGAQVTTNLMGNINTWTTHSGQYAVPNGQYLTRYFFVAISTSTNNETVGNHIDNVWFNTTLPPANAGQGRVTIAKKIYGLPEEKLSEIKKEQLIQYNTANENKKNANLVDNTWTSGSDEKGNYYAINYATDTLTIKANESIACTITENQNEAKIPGYALNVEGDGQTVTLVDSSGNREKTVTITNTYTPTVTDITVKKEVTGSMGDKTKGFSFDFSYVNEEGSTIRKKKTLKNGEFFELTGVKIGSDVTLTEKNAANYTTSATYGNAKISPSEQDTSSETKTITVTNITADQKLITVTNNKEAIPDTGVNLNSTPYILMLGIMAAGAGVLLFRRRKRWS